ncbi:MFS transporter [Maricaulaceae bacterium MS644]
MKRVFLISVAVALLSTLGQLSSTIFTPLSESITTEMGIATSKISTLVSIFLVSFAFSQLFSGVIGERLGFIRIIFLSILIFIGGSIYAALAQSYSDLIFARILQGVGAGPALILSRAALTTALPQKSLTTAFAIQNIVFAVVPALAPLLGALLGSAFGWRSVFFATAALALLIFALTARVLSSALNVAPASPSDATEADRTGAGGYPLGSVLFWATLGAVVYAPVFVTGGLLPPLLSEQEQWPPTALAIVTAGGVISFVLGGAIAAVLDRDTSRLGATEAASMVLFFLIIAPVLAITAFATTELTYAIATIYLATGFAGAIMTLSVSVAMNTGRRRAGLTSSILGFTHLSFGAVYLSFLTATRLSVSEVASIVSLTVWSGVLVFVMRFIMKEQVWKWRWGAFERNLATGEYLLPFGLLSRIKEIKEFNNSNKHQ